MYNNTHILRHMEKEASRSRVGAALTALVNPVSNKADLRPTIITAGASLAGAGILTTNQRDLFRRQQAMQQRQDALEGLQSKNIKRSDLSSILEDISKQNNFYTTSG